MIRSAFPHDRFSWGSRDLNYEEDPQAWREELSAKLAPARIRSTLAFAGLFQMTHEMIKRTVIDDVKGFFGYSPLNDGTWFSGRHTEIEYKRDVLALEPGRVFYASLLWLKDSEAITLTQVARLEEIYDYRHEVTHELARFIVDVDSEPDVSLLTEAVQIMRDISRFWVQMEKDIGTFDEYGDVDVAAVKPGSLLILDMCIHAYVEGLTLPAPTASE